jgi:hypothetical protein
MPARPVLIFAPEAAPLPSVGLIANPQSGKDIRRLVALASSFSNHEKLLILRRVLAGLEATGAAEVIALDDSGSLGAAALEAYRNDSGAGSLKIPKIKTRLIDIGARGESGDTSRAAARMREEGAACIVVLGGDGTSRAAAKGCGNCPLVPLSTGTNNAFSQNWEGTVAGLAAGLYAKNPRRYSRQVMSSKRLLVHLEGAGGGGGGREIALVDVALINEAYAGARAVWDIDRIEALVLTQCEPGGLGLSALGASIAPIGPGEPEGLWIEFAAAGGRSRAGGRKRTKTVISPIGPGLVARAHIRKSRRISPGEQIKLSGRSDQVLAFDGEREYVLSEGEPVGIELDWRGPRVLDVPAILEWAARGGHLSGVDSGGLNFSRNRSRK